MIYCGSYISDLAINAASSYQIKKVVTQQWGTLFDIAVNFYSNQFCMTHRHWRRFVPLLLLSLLFQLSAIVAQPTNFYHHTGNDSIFDKNKLIVRNASGDTVEVAKWKSGQKHGKQIIYYNNGAVLRVSNFKKGLLHGTVKHFVQGKKEPHKVEKYKAFPAEGRSKLHGANQSFDAAGQLTEKINWKNGDKNGKYVRYHNNGAMQEQGTYKNNLNTGRKRTYSNTGVLIRDEHFIIIDNPDYKPLDTALSNEIKTRPQPAEISVLHGNIKYYFHTGQRASECLYHHGAKQGVCKEYHQNENSTLKSSVVFKNGLEHGPFAYYRSNGNLEREGIFYREITVEDTLLKNVYDGTIHYYQDNGKRHRTENWKNFKKNGVQEMYYHRTGELSQRTHLKDNLKSGIEERFDKDGTRNYLAHFEVIEKDGVEISQQTGTETYWEKGQVKTTVEWKNGAQEGSARSYYLSGQLEKLMHFKGGKLQGRYHTYYENGQLKSNFNKQHWIGTGNPENIGWNTEYDETGNITRSFFALGNTQNTMEHQFEDGKRKLLLVNNFLRMESSPHRELSSVKWLNGWQTALGFDLFSDHSVRRVHFEVDQHAPLTANFTTNSDVIQITSSTGARVEEDYLRNTAQQLAASYNPNWKDHALMKHPFPEGRFQWDFADGSPFFDIAFTDSLPQGTWICYNPILADTLFYGAFEKGRPVGNGVQKKLDGTLKSRTEYHNNHQVKKQYIYGNNGIISSISISDSTGNQLFKADYYANGQLREERKPPTNSYVIFADNGDTLSYNLLFPEKDSIRQERQFYPGNRIKSDRHNNLITGVGFAKTYFENGQMQTAHELKDRASHGVYQRFDESGKLLVFGNFKNGARHGKWITFNPDGTETPSYFKEGEIILPDPTENNDTGACICFDTSLQAGHIGFANSLAYFAEYDKIQPFVPASIFPMTIGITIKSTS